MTKKTNSLLQRFGISSVWFNKFTCNFVFSNIIQLKQLIFFFFNAHSFKILFTYFTKNVIFIYFINLSSLDTLFFSNIISCFKQNNNIGYLLNRFGVGLKQLASFLQLSSSKLIHVCFSTLFGLVGFSVFKLFQKKKQLIFAFFLFSKVCNSNSSFLFSKDIFIFAHTFNLNLSFFPIKNIVSFSFLLVRKKFGFIKTKLTGIILENLIFIVLHKCVRIRLKNIFLVLSGLRLPLFGKKQLLDLNWRQNSICILVSFYFTQGLLLAELIGSVLNKAGKQHVKVLRSFVFFIESALTVVRCNGFQLRISGKLGGALRATKYHYQYGILQKQTFNVNLTYTFLPVFTKFGVFSVKIWIVN